LLAATDILTSSDLLLLYIIVVTDLLISACPLLQCYIVAMDNPRPLLLCYHCSDALVATDHLSIAIVTYCLWRRRTCSTRHLKEEATKDADCLVLSMGDNEEVIDEFKGSTVWSLAYSVPPPEDNLPYDYSSCATRVE
jgi:hypothetical protein